MWIFALDEFEYSLYQIPSTSVIQFGDDTEIPPPETDPLDAFLDVDALSSFPTILKCDTSKMYGRVVNKMWWPLSFSDLRHSTLPIDGDGLRRRPCPARATGATKLESYEGVPAEVRRQLLLTPTSNLIWAAPKDGASVRASFDYDLGAIKRRRVVEKKNDENALRENQLATSWSARVSSKRRLKIASACAIKLLERLEHEVERGVVSAPFTCFGQTRGSLDVLPLDLQRRIVELSVEEGVLREPRALAALVPLALRQVCKDFKRMFDGVLWSALSALKADMQTFVDSGTVRGQLANANGFSSVSYRVASASASLVLEATTPLRYLKMRASVPHEVSEVSRDKRRDILQRRAEIVVARCNRPCETTPHWRALEERVGRFSEAA